MLTDLKSLHIRQLKEVDRLKNARIDDAGAHDLMILAIRAEAKLCSILDQLGEGKPELHYQGEWALAGKYLIDFFFPSVRLAVEVDGQPPALEDTTDRRRLVVLPDRTSLSR